jgi:hypothetical protein
MLCFIGFLFFTDTSSRVYRMIAGPLHAATHLAATFLISWQVSHLLSGGRGLNFGSTWQLLEASALIFAGGWIVGSAIMGVYLFVSLNIFGRHHNDAFSALRIADYKNFLRLKIEDNGDLVVYPIGVEKVIKRWKKGKAAAGENELVPASIRPENLPFLIEEPIRFAKPYTAEVPQPLASAEVEKSSTEPAGKVVELDVR